MLLISSFYHHLVAVVVVVNFSYPVVFDVSSLYEMRHLPARRFVSSSSSLFICLGCSYYSYYSERQVQRLVRTNLEIPFILRLLIDSPD